MIVTGIADIRKKLAENAVSLQNADKKLYKIVGEVRNRIQRRTRSGKDVDNTSFAEYAQFYKEYKIVKKRPGAPVNLTFTGDMLNHMDVRQINGGGEIYFNDTLQATKAKAHHFGLGQKERKFFGLSKPDKEYVLTEFKAKL